MKLRNILLLLGLIGFAVVVVLNAHQFSNFIHLLRSLRWYIVILVIIVQLFSYYVNALYYRSILRVFEYTIKTSRLFEAALAANFVDYILPSAGLAGAGFLSQVLSPEVPRGQGVLCQLVRYAFSALAVLLMFPVGFSLIILSKHSSHHVVMIALLSTLIIIGAAVIIVTLIQHEFTLRRLVKWLESKTSRVFNKLKKEPIDRFIDEFYAGYHGIMRHKRLMLAPFGWSIVYIVIEILTLYMSFLAFGKTINPGIVIMGYLLANIASTFGGAFISTGIFEIGMLGTFVALGLPFTLALSVTIVYRVLNLLIGLPPGFYFYRKYLPK